jgi:hypothetical protein
MAPEYSLGSWHDALLVCTGAQPLSHRNWVRFSGNPLDYTVCSDELPMQTIWAAWENRASKVQLAGTTGITQVNVYGG